MIGKLPLATSRTTSTSTTLDHISPLAFMLHTPSTNRHQVRFRFTQKWGSLIQMCFNLRVGIKFGTQFNIELYIIQLNRTSIEIHYFHSASQCHQDETQRERKLNFKYGSRIGWRHLFTWTQMTRRRIGTLQKSMTLQILVFSSSIYIFYFLQ
jgi:hypothetical protein